VELKPVTFRPIGVIRSEHRDEDATPIQPPCARGCPGRVDVLDEYTEGLQDIEGFSHVHLLYHLHRAGPARLSVVPFLDDVPHGVFATRSPWRPNPLGMSLARLIRREGSTLFIEDVDVLDGTPLLDIKPYVARFDAREGARCGWTDDVGAALFAARGRRDRISRPHESD
jgi:tRNA-Thr(GGU) m(6)t(6)A37 methyltransferase TsaA